MSPTDLNHGLLRLRARLEARLDAGEVGAVAASLIAVPSHRDVPGRETACAQRMAEIWRGWGFEPEVTPIAGGRPPPRGANDAIRSLRRMARRPRGPSGRGASRP